MKTNSIHWAIMRKRLIMRRLVLLLLGSVVLASAALGQSVRVKDIATIDGVRSNQLVGYGLVIGLAGTGDSQQAKFTMQSVANMLQAYGITVPADKLKLKNVAAVMLTAELPPFARPGTKIDVTVSSIGDSPSLQGGTLIQSPLKAANGSVYAVAQGPLSIGGFSAGGGGGSVSKNHATVGLIPQGAMVERATTTGLQEMKTITVTLNKGDFTTANRVADAINAKLGERAAVPSDASSVSIKVPNQYTGDVVPLIAQIEAVEVTTDTIAKVIVNERTGTVIIGGSVRILPVAVSHGALTVEVNTDTSVSQPPPLSGGTTVVAQQKTVEVKEDKNSLVRINDASTIDELVRALNTLKVTPRDLIAILQATKEAGALEAQLEII
jgi:flagellar P-ring protein FlgI